MTSPLTLTWPGGTLTDPTSAVTIGRDPNNTVAIDAQVISRTHGVIVWVNGGWVYRDLGSSFGSFVQGRRVQEIAVDGPMVLTLGQGEDAVPIEVRIDRQTLEDPHRGFPGGDPVLAATAVGAQRPTAGQGGGPARPGGALGVGRADPTLVRGDDGGPTLTVREGGRVHEVTARAGATIGREADNTIVLDEATVSRHHLRIDNTPAGWVVTDLGSASGTWSAGARVGRLAVPGPTLLTVGDLATGPRLELQPNEAGGAAPSSKRGATRRWIAVACAVVLVAAIGFGSWWFFIRKPAADTAQLVQGTVFILAADNDGNRWSGSGTIVDAERGLILTNAHVAAPTAVGLAVQYGKLFPEVGSPKTLEVSVSPGLDRAAEPRFRAEVVAEDGFLDLAVIKITETLSGNPVTPADLATLTEVPIGSSDETATGDEVHIIGFPGQAESEAATVSRGVISGSQAEDRLADPRAWFLSDAFSGGGNSGGLVANESGEIVGVLSKGTIPSGEGEDTLSGARPINFAAPLLEAARTGGSYVTPWAVAVPDGAELGEPKFSLPGAFAGVDADCEDSDGFPLPLAVGLPYSGFGTAAHTDVLAVLLERSETGWEQVERLSNFEDYPLALADSGCLRITFRSSLPAGDYSMLIGVGGDLALQTDLQFTVS